MKSYQKHIFYLVTIYFFTDFITKLRTNEIKYRNFVFGASHK